MKMQLATSGMIQQQHLQGDKLLQLQWMVIRYTTNSLERRLLFNSVCCQYKCIHISFRSKIQTTYHIGLSPITMAITHRGISILVSSDLSWEPHYQSIIAKSNKLLGLLRRTFSNHNSINFKKQLYISLVCSQLLHCSVLWKPHLIKHIQLFEQVQ